MWISAAFAQGANAAKGPDMLTSFLPIILIFVVFWFLLIRPQQKRMKEHKLTVANLRRNDKVVTGGGIIGKVTKVTDGAEVEVEIAKDVKVKIARSTISQVLSKSGPASEIGPGGQQGGPGGLFGGLFGRR